LPRYYCDLPTHTYTICNYQGPYIRPSYFAGSLDCRLCSTMDTNERPYLAHTQGKKYHQYQTNLARRAAGDAKDTQFMIAPEVLLHSASTVQRQVFHKIGRPGYRVTKVRDTDTGKEGMLVQVHLPHGGRRRRHPIKLTSISLSLPNRTKQSLLYSRS